MAKKQNQVENANKTNAKGNNESSNEYNPPSFSFLQISNKSIQINFKANRNECITYQKLNNNTFHNENNYQNQNNQTSNNKSRETSKN